MQGKTQGANVGVESAALQGIVGKPFDCFFRFSKQRAKRLQHAGKILRCG